MESHGIYTSVLGFFHILVTILKFILTIACKSGLFLSIVEKYFSIVLKIAICLFIHHLVDIWLAPSCFDMVNIKYLCIDKGKL